MKDRLIKLLETDIECNKDGHGDCSMCEYKYADDKCAHYLSAIIADFLLANGVIVPPCKVGDTVYRIVEMGTGVHYKQVGCSQGYIIVPCPEKIKRFIRSGAVTKNNFFYVCENFGKTVFLTKELAEEALKNEQEKL